MIDQKQAQHFIARMLHAQQALTRVKLEPWADEVLMLMPREASSFATYTHYTEALAKAFATWESTVEVQMAHDAADLRDAKKAVTALASDARRLWNAYKDRHGLVAIPSTTEGQ